MIITPEMQREVSQIAGREISVELLTAMSKIVANDRTFTKILPLIGEALKESPADASTEKTVKFVLETVQKMGEARREKQPGNSKKATREYFEKFWLEQRLMDAVIPSTTMKLFGKEFQTPIMTAALSHLRTVNPSGISALKQYALAAKKSGCVHWVGMCENAEFGDIMEAGAPTIRIIKPYLDDEKVLSQIKCAKEAGALAVGIDIDHTFSDDGSIDVIFGESMAVKSSEKIREYIEYAKLPFIIKGVLSVRDAVACQKLGAQGIVVSHHGGRMNYALPPLAVLPDILKVVGNEVSVFVDCGISSGADAYKALAMGAKAVSVGTHLLPYLYKGGPDAVAGRIREMNSELKGFMANTGVADVDHFDPSVLHTIEG